MFSSLVAQDTQKVILDCDLGDDIDDAFAVALTLISPEFEVLGLVMDYGNTPKRAQIACRMLYETGREDIPVVIGRKTKDHYSPQFQWGEGFTGLKPLETNAADFIIQNLRKYPNEVILFTVGPVPNMKDVLDKDPEALKLAKHIYSMFGSFYMGYGRDPVPDAEWNVQCDVEASRAFASCGAPITYVPLDITTFIELDEANRLKLLMRKSPLTDALSGLYVLWGQETPVLYDVVAIGMVLWPDLFSTRSAHVKVIDGGYTVIDESREPNSRIGMSIHETEFIKRIMERYLSQNLNRMNKL
jgi:inosine-uridine nucleoside N-ribohydrolase